MLKKLILISFLLTSFSALACWRVVGSLGIDGESFKIDQKFEHGREYSLPMGTFILNLSIKSDKKNQTAKYSVQEKKGATLKLVTRGTEEIFVNKSTDIYAKGEEGQPNSILTLKLTDI